MGMSRSRKDPYLAHLQGLEVSTSVGRHFIYDIRPFVLLAFWLFGLAAIPQGLKQQKTMTIS